MIIEDLDRPYEAANFREFDPANFEKRKKISQKREIPVADDACEIDRLSVRCVPLVLAMRESSLRNLKHPLPFSIHCDPFE